MGVKAISLRLPAELHQELRLLALFSGRSANEIIVGLVGDYLDREGRAVIERGMTARAQAAYGDALSKLAE